MAIKRNLSLSPRKENERESQPVTTPVQFTLSEIKQHFTESMRSIKEQYDVANSLAADGNTIGCETVWRSQVVFAEGLLDFYIHEISKYCLFRMFTGQWSHSEKYESIMVPMEKVEEAIATTESKNWFFDYLNVRFSRDVFISCESMKDQLNLIGIGFAQTMIRAFPNEKDEYSVKLGKKVVEELFHRRNVIVHQNDRSHESAEQSPITKEFVEDYISKVEAIVTSIQEIAEKKDQAM